LTKEEIQEYLAGLPKNRIRELLAEALIPEGATFKQAQTEINRTVDVMKTKMFSEVTDTLKPRFDDTMLMDALSYQLTNESIPADVYSYVQEVYNKDDDWMKVARHSPLTEKVVKKVSVELFKTDYEIVDKAKEKGLSIKDAIRKGKTPSQQIRSVHKHITLSDRVDALEAKVAELDFRQTVSEMKVEQIGNHLSLQLDPNRVLAIKLKQAGYTQKEISIELGVTTRTLRNWFKELKGKEET